MIGLDEEEMMDFLRLVRSNYGKFDRDETIDILEGKLREIKSIFEVIADLDKVLVKSMTEEEFANKYLASLK